MLRSVARQHAGEVLEVSPAECGGSRVESYFHNFILKNLVHMPNNCYLYRIKQGSLMKKVLLIWLLAAGFASAGATAQNVALGERVPELKIQTWLDNRQARTGPDDLHRIFPFDESPPCKTSLERLKEITGKSGTKLRVIVVTKEDPAKIGPADCAPTSRNGSPWASTPKRVSRRSASATCRSAC